MKNSIEDIIFSAIIGDASGYTLGGMKSAHIKAVFKGEEGYPDPAPALKGNMDRWRKPGLYSSITQFMLIAAASVEKDNFRAGRFVEAVKKAPEHPESEFSFFRGPGQAEQYLISAARVENKETIVPFTGSCARILPIAIPLLLGDNEQSLLKDTLELVSFFTTNTTTAAYTFIFLQILRELSLAEGKGRFSECAMESALKAAQVIDGAQNRIFDCGYNPDYFIESADIFIKLLQGVAAVRDMEKGEKLICESVNLRLKTPVTRCSVNLPEAILPFALLLSELTEPHSAVYHNASREGGAASALASVSSALTTAFYGLDVPDNLREEIANKKKITHMIELLASKSGRGEIIRVLYDSEPGLTSKEMEEYRGRNKKEPKKPGPQKSRKDVESELTRHVVESWTKIDKAKWRKERNKHES